MRVPSSCLAAVVVTMLSAAIQPAIAGTIFINSATPSGTTSTATQALYRISNVNFDSRLTNGQSAATSANTITGAMGNYAALNGNTYDFALQWVAGTVNVNRGFVWTLSTGTGVVSRLAFGTFSPPLSPTPNTQQASLNSIAPSGTFNTLSLSQRSDLTSGGSTVTLADLAFSTSAPGTLQTGTWINASVITPNGGPVPPGINGSNGFLNQWMNADFDLSADDWLLTGKVTVTKGASGGDDNATFQISARQVEFVPEPSQMVFVAGVGVVLGAWRIRKLRRNRGESEAAVV